MDKRKKAWMATFGAILIGHAYGKPSEPKIVETDSLIPAKIVHHAPACPPIELHVTTCTPPEPAHR